ncbi:hypothetical protein RB608_16270 [Nocardioides sp. LHD-245]|uniref:hypothetical protein n=1 Tax=Nocardioides sp. LHD-245 TaxID=3051387 RepID=UPI0027E166C1|nr:hypothetical protein [Nocardioides sp. LHD-245]
MTEIAPSPPTTPRPGRRRRVAAVAGTVGVVAVIGAGGWAWQDWLAQGPQASEVLPADTLAYVGLDLDPPGGQKIGAYRTLKRFPSIAKHLGLNSQDDLRGSLLDRVTAESGCDLRYDDLADWAGDRAALALVPRDGTGVPEPVAVVQVDDPDEARSGLDKAVANCGDEVGYALGDDWAVLARTDEVARAVVADGGRARLGDDADFQELTSAAGETGVLTLYAAPEAGQALLDAVEEEPFLSLLLTMPFGLSSSDPVDLLMAFTTFASVGTDFEEDLEEGLEVGSEDGFEDGMSPEERRLWKRMDDLDKLSAAEQEQLMDEMDAFYADQPGSGGVAGDDDLALPEDELPELPEFDDDQFMEDFSIPIPDAVRDRLAGFTGLGGVARFDDGALELEIVADPLLTGPADRYDGTDALAAISGLPDDAALAFGGGFAEGWAEQAITDGPMAFGGKPEKLLAGFEKATGLTPEDLEDLGGDTVAFVAGPGFEDAFDFDGVSGDAPIAARITGDVAKIEAALEKVRAAMGGADFLPSVRAGDAVVVGADRAFVERVAKASGTLGDSERFAKAVPDADRALTITYADFDQGDWTAQLDDGDLAPADLAPLDTVGMTLSDAGERQRIVLRLTFDD